MAHRVRQPAPSLILTPARPPSRATSSTAIWLSGIIAAGLVLRLALLPFRWVNPDEGAHLMDGQLILHGLVPLVDFASRQPLYAYVQAGMLAAFHGSYLAARLLPVVAIMGTALLVFLIARRLFNARIALLATAIYVFHPLVVIWSPIVKTEPLTAFLSSVGIYCTVRFIQSDDRWRFLALAGAALGLAFYVRQSSLAVGLAVVASLVIVLRRQPRQLARTLGALAGGGLCIVALAVAYYARYMTPAQLWSSNLNPFQLVIGAADKLSPIPVTGTAGTGGDALRLGLQSWAATIAAVRETLAVNAFLFAGLAASLGIAIYLRARRPVELRRYAQPLVLLYCWAFALMLAYAYWAIHRGYFTQYFGETIPPLAIVLAFSLWYLSGILASASTGLVPAVALAVGLATVFAAYRVWPTLQVPNLIVVLVPALLVALVYLDGAQRKRWGGLLAVAAAAIVVGGAAGSFVSQHLVTLVKALVAILALVVIAVLGRTRGVERGAYIALALIVTACVTAFAASGRAMGVAYQCVWSPRTVADVARYIRAHSSNDAQMMSGAVIWAVAANRPPFMRIAHPLAFDGGAPPEVAARMRASLDSAPPRLIVLDGYTNRTFLSYLDPDGKLLATRYRLDKVFSGSRYPVKVYELNSPLSLRTPCCSTSSE